MENGTKVLDKCFGLLEFIAKRHGECVLPQEAAAVLGLTRPTCIRLLKAMTALGYLEQVSRQKGYRLGPVSFWLGGGGRYRAGLALRAEPLVEACAREIGMPVLLAIRHETSRMIVAGCNPDPAFGIDNSQPRYNDLFQVISGQLLLAYEAPEVRAELFGRVAGAGENTGTFVSPEAFQRRMDELRDAGFGVLFVGGRGSAAVPVLCNDRCVAVLAAAWPEDGAYECVAVVAALQRYAGRLGGMLSDNLMAW